MWPSGSQADAVTVNVYMGRDAICPFLSHSDAACVFAECRPAGAMGLAGLKGIVPGRDESSLALYEHVARLCQELSAAQSQPVMQEPCIALHTLDFAYGAEQTLP